MGMTGKLKVKETGRLFVEAGAMFQKYGKKSAVVLGEKMGFVFLLVAGGIVDTDQGEGWRWRESKGAATISNKHRIKRKFNIFKQLTYPSCLSLVRIILSHRG
jgi:hypothetical protein